jgi:hypothetical protein
MFRTFVRLAILMVALVLSVSAAQADPFAFGAGGLTTPSPGDMLNIQGNLSENLITGTGQTNFGIGFVASIQDMSKPGSPIVWAQGVGGQGQLTFTFNNFSSTSITPGGLGQNLTFSGGNLNFFYNPSIIHTVTGSMGTNAMPDASGTFATGAPILTAAGIPGIIPGDLTTTINATVTQLTSPFTGEGAGNLTTTGGLAGNAFHDFLNGQNLFFNFVNNAPDPNPGSPWPVGSSAAALQNTPAPIATTAGIPEPASMLLWGTVAAGIGVCGGLRRSRKK